MPIVVMERGFSQPVTEQLFRERTADLEDCVALHRAQWHESFLALDGSLLTCCFEAPDAESIRMLSRGDASDSKSVWTGARHSSDLPGLANVVVERRFQQPVTVASVQALEDAANWCLQEYQVTFLRTYLSADGCNMVCLYQAPDAESVRLAQEQAQMPVTRVWACQNFTLAQLRP